MQTLRILCVVSVSIALSGVRLPAAPKQNFVDSNGSRVAEFLKQNFSNGDGGMVIALIDGHGSRVVSAGTLDNGTDRQLDGDTLFEIGSITKTFTSLLLLDIVKRGEMSLDDPVAEYLPENVKVPTHEGKEISLLHLSAQDSGLPFNPDNLADKFWVDAYNEYTQDDLYDFLAAYKLEIDPGERFQYSNVGMTLLGHAIERHTGADFESLVIDRICRPLEMGDTLITLSPDKMPRVAMGHDIEGKRAPKYDLRVIAPAGGLLSTANDLLKYLSANLGFVESELYPLMKEMQQIRHTNGAQLFGKSAMPWYDQDVFNPPGTSFLGHGGGTPGGTNFVGFDLMTRRAIVVLSNQRKVNASVVGWQILQDMPLTTDNWLVRQRVGIGTALDSDDKSGLVRITRVFPKSSAAQAGLKAGLLIQSVNNISVVDKSLAECLNMMSGPAGTVIRLEIVDQQSDSTKTVELTKQSFLTSS